MSVATWGALNGSAEITGRDSRIKGWAENVGRWVVRFAAERAG